MSKMTKGDKKLQNVMIKLFNFDPYEKTESKKFNWPWKSSKPVIRVFADSSPISDSNDNDKNKK